jgi:RNA polymerase sigma factor (sigma-70 family)
LLIQDFQARIGGKRYFPISILREACRQFLKHPALAKVDRLAFYRSSSDAILAVMADSSIADAAHISNVLRDMLLVADTRDPDQALLLRLHYVAGLNWAEIVALLDVHHKSIDPEQAARDLAGQLNERGLSQEALFRQNLRPRGQVTQLLEDVRDGQRPLGDVVVNERARLRRQAEHLLRLEGGNISLQADDLVNEMFLRMPKTPEKSPVNHMEFEALTKRIMRHILVDRARKPIPGQSKFSSELSQDLATSPVVEERLLEEKVLQVVHEVIEEMRATDRETADMLHGALFRCADQKELAKLHAVSVSTVKRRIKDARDRIRARLGLE